VQRSPRGARASRARRRSLAARLLGLVLKVGLLLLVVAAGTLLYLSRQINVRFESGLWAVPTKAYSAPLVLRPDARLTLADLKARLSRMGYRMTADTPRVPGQFRVKGNSIELHTRDFVLPGGGQRGQAARAGFSEAGVVSLMALPSREPLERLAVEPEIIATLHGAQREDRTILPLSEFPPHLIQAVIAAEDRRFLEHHGLDPLRIARALWENVLSGEVRQGGSTITQQTVKNLFLGHERTLSRKIREALMAIVLEARYPKEKILEVYLNEIYLGQRSGASVCGFGEAARFYFGKDASDLSLADAALLVGLIPSPATANPFLHPERARARRDLVLASMREQGRISEREHRLALAEKPVLASGSAEFRRAPHFVQFLRQHLEGTYSGPVLTGGGLRVFTTLDTSLQAAAEQAIARGLASLEKAHPRLKRRGKDPLEAALVAMHPATGDVLALVGGRNFHRSQFDRAVQARRQPGSLFKPLVYLAGFERAAKDTRFSFTPVTLLDDSPIELRSGGKTWRPENYDNQFRGPVSVRQALEQSLNVPTVRAAQQIGLDEIVRLASRCGVESPLRPLPSIALGAQEASPMEMATAFSVIANGGRRVEPRVIKEVVDAGGDVIEKDRARPSAVVSPAAAYVTLDILRGVVDRGTARLARDSGLAGDLAGKTGTTNGKRDSWFIGMSPELLVAVWVGFDDGAETGLSGSTGALPIWIDLMRRVGPPVGAFQEPPGVVRVAIDPGTGALATDACPEVVVELFVAGTEPVDECQDHGSGFGRWLRRLFHRPAKQQDV